MAEYFFHNKSGQLEISQAAVKTTYAVYTTLLANVHRTLSKSYQEMATALNEESKAESDVDNELQFVELPALASLETKPM